MGYEFCSPWYTHGTGAFRYFKSETASRSSDETVSRPPRSTPETNRTLVGWHPNRKGIAMNRIVANVLKSKAAEAQTEVRPFSVVAMFCATGLLALLCMASVGFDVSGGIF